MTDEPEHSSASTSPEAPHPSDSKLTRTKQRWAQEGKFLTGHATRPDADRLPPGQHLTQDWPVLDLGLHPAVPLGCCLERGQVLRA